MKMLIISRFKQKALTAKLLDREEAKKNNTPS